MEAIHIYPTKAQEKVIIAFLEALEVPFDKEEQLPTHVLQRIEAGRKDIASGRSITFQDFKEGKRGRWCEIILAQTAVETFDAIYAQIEQKFWYFGCGQA